MTKERRQQLRRNQLPKSTQKLNVAHLLSDENWDMQSFYGHSKGGRWYEMPTGVETASFHCPKSIRQLPGKQLKEKAQKTIQHQKNITELAPVSQRATMQGMSSPKQPCRGTAIYRNYPSDQRQTTGSTSKQTHCLTFFHGGPQYKSLL